MEEKDFKGSRMGRVVWETKGMFYRFEPHMLPPKFKINPAIPKQLLKTALFLGKLDGMTDKISKSEIGLLRLPFILKEARLSLEIEGTRTTLTELYNEEKEKEKDIEKGRDIEEVKNYVDALEFGLNNINDGISEMLIKNIHKKLLKGVRGSNKQPGIYKTKQNAIGEREDTIETARFVPASPEATPHLMNNLIDFWSNDSEIDILCKIAIFHYQFEAIHPFRDGNGRIGRLLIMLEMCQEKIIKYPLLYISEFFNRNRSTYTDLLLSVSSKNNLEDWILFFLKAMEIQAKASISLINKLESYKDGLLKKTEEISKSPNMHLLINIIFRNPFVRISDVSKELKISIPAASNLIGKLEKNGVLKELTKKKNRKLYVANRIIEILNERTIQE